MMEIERAIEILCAEGENLVGDYRFQTLEMRDRKQALDLAVTVLREKLCQKNPLTLYTLEEWSEGDGPVLWWMFPIEEPPYVGSPICCDWPGYHTHWTYIISPEPPKVPPIKRCWDCVHYDKNDPIHCYGTCQILDEDFHVTHECTCPPEEIRLVESLLAERDGEKGDS